MRKVAFAAKVALIVVLSCGVANAYEYKRVLLVSFDGLGAEYFENNAKFQETFKNGYYAPTRTVNPPRALPSHASLVSGMRPDFHGITWNNYRPNYGEIEVSTLFDVFHKNGWHTAAVIGKQKLRHILSPGQVDEVYQNALLVKALELAEKELDLAGRPMIIQKSFVFLHLPQIDSAGHQYGWGSLEYQKEVELVARLFSIMFKKWIEDPFTLIVITADHGGRERTHPASCEECYAIPAVFNGYGLPRQKFRGDKANIYDIPVTILTVAGLPIPKGWEGKSLINR